MTMYETGFPTDGLFHARMMASAFTGMAVRFLGASSEPVNEKLFKIRTRIRIRPRIMLTS